MALDRFLLWTGLFLFLVAFVSASGGSVGWYNADTDARVASEYVGGYGKSVYARVVLDAPLSSPAVFSLSDGSTIGILEVNSSEGVSDAFVIDTFQPLTLSLVSEGETILSRSIVAINTPPRVVDVGLRSIAGSDCLGVDCELTVRVSDEDCESISIGGVGEVVGVTDQSFLLDDFVRNQCFFVSKPFSFSGLSSGDYLLRSDIEVVDGGGLSVGDRREFLVGVVRAEASEQEVCPVSVVGGGESFLLSSDSLSSELLFRNVGGERVFFDSSLSVSSGFPVLTGQFLFDDVFSLGSGVEDAYLVRYVPVVGEDLLSSRYVLSLSVRDGGGVLLCDFSFPVVVGSSSGVGVVGVGSRVGSGFFGVPLWAWFLLLLFVFLLFWLLWLS